MIRYSEDGQPYDDGTGPAYGPEDQQYIEYQGSDEYGNYGTMYRRNPNYNYDKYATPEQRAFDSRSRGRSGLFGAIDRVGRTVENNLIQPLAPYVNSALERGANAVGKYGVPLAALAISGGTAAEFLPALMAAEGGAGAAGLDFGAAYEAGAGATAAEGGAGLTSAELSALQTAASNEIASGGISGGAGGGLPTAGTNALAPSVTNALAPAAAATAANQYIPAALGAAAQVAGGAMANRSITDVANTAAASADKNLAFQRDMFNTIRADQEPFRAAGVSALGKLTPLMDYKKFSMDDFKADPGYNFRFTQGQRALDSSASARGGIMSGKALKDAVTFGQEMGSQEFTNARNRFVDDYNQSTRVPLAVAGYGQTATNNMQQGATNYGNTAGQIMQNAGDTQANSQLARGSVYANTGNQLAQNILRYRTV